MASTYDDFRMDMVEIHPISKPQEHRFLATYGVEPTRSTQSPPLKSITKLQPLRTSCKACSDSKVKCEKGKPVCSRCQMRGLYCVYQQSRRTGRRPHRTRPLASGSQTQMSPTDLTPQKGGDENIERMESSDLPDCHSQESAWDSTNFNSGDYSYAMYDTDYTEFDFADLQALPSPTPYTPPLTSSSSHPEAQVCSPSHIQNPLFPSQRSLPKQPDHVTLLETWNRFPLKRPCDCISRLLAVSTQSAAESSTPSAPGIQSTCESRCQNAFDVCKTVLACNCISDDERAISLLSFVILNTLLQAGEMEWSKRPEAFDEADAMRNPLTLVKTLAVRLHACQPGFAKAKNPFILYWLATMGS